MNSDEVTTDLGKVHNDLHQLEWSVKFCCTIDQLLLILRPILKHYPNRSLELLSSVPHRESFFKQILYGILFQFLIGKSLH